MEQIKKEVVLGIDTSGLSFSVALASDGKLIYEVFLRQGLAHSELLLPEIEKALKVCGINLADITKIAVCQGPGSFTGIRIGLVCARTLAQMQNIPVVALNSLSIIAEGLENLGVNIIPALDALRGEVYVLRNKVADIESFKEFALMLKSIKKPTVVAGSAAKLYTKEITAIKNKNIMFADEVYNYPRAGILCLMAQNIKGVHFSKAIPCYIKRSWAEENSKNQKRKK